MFKNSLNLYPSPIEFGTDGWRGILGVDITLERLLRVAIAATQELAARAPEGLTKNVIIGYDRRFLAPEFAEAITSAVRACGLTPLIASRPVTTPACSWAVLQHKAIGALVVTASHNPPEWLGLKLKGPNGASVEADFTKAIEQRLAVGGITNPVRGVTESFQCREEHLAALRSKFDLPSIVQGLKAINLKVIVDPMHGSAAGCFEELFQGSLESLEEIRTNRDPLFGGNPPEPLEKNLNAITHAVKVSNLNGRPAIGLVFDGDGDRIVAIDEDGKYCSNQLLIPLFIEHLAARKSLPGCVIKTVSGSDLMRILSESLGREVIELPVGFKYIASEMSRREVLLGGEESGGIGFGAHIPERDALYAALLLLETIAEQGLLLGSRIEALQNRFGQSFYDRVDIKLADENSKIRLQTALENNPPKSILEQEVKELIKIDGFKFRLGIFNWIMFRFSGTEPLLRIYCESPDRRQVQENLKWAKNLARNI